MLARNRLCVKTVLTMIHREIRIALTKHAGALVILVTITL